MFSRKYLNQNMPKTRCFFFKCKALGVPLLSPKHLLAPGG